MRRTILLLLIAAAAQYRGEDVPPATGGRVYPTSTSRLRVSRAVPSARLWRGSTGVVAAPKRNLLVRLGEGHHLHKINRQVRGHLGHPRNSPCPRGSSVFRFGIAFHAHKWAGGLGPNGRQSAVSPAGAEVRCIYVFISQVIRQVQPMTLCSRSRRGRRRQWSH